LSPRAGPDTVARVRISSLLAATIPFVALAGCGAAQGGGTADNAASPGPMGSSTNTAVCSPLPTAPGSQRVVAMPAAEREALEARLAGGPVAVKQEGCKLVVVPACELRADTRYTPEAEEKTITLSNGADVDRDVPLGKERFDAALSAGHPLTVKLAQAGRFTFGGATATTDAKAACQEATHVIRAFTVGAFEVAEAGSGATVEKAGDREACGKGSGSGKPAAGCGSLVSIELVALHASDDIEERPHKPSSPITPPSPITGPAEMAGGDGKPGGMVGGTPRGEQLGGESEGRGVTGKDQGRPLKFCPPKDPLCAY